MRSGVSMVRTPVACVIISICLKIQTGRETKIQIQKAAIKHFPESSSPHPLLLFRRISWFPPLQQARI